MWYELDVTLWGEGSEADHKGNHRTLVGNVHQILYHKVTVRGRSAQGQMM